MQDKQDLLIELGTEDLPARLLKNELGLNFSRNIATGLQKLKIGFDGYTKTLVSPRRIAVIVNSVSIKQEDQCLAKYGPTVKSAFDDTGAPTKAALGFAKSCGVEVGELEQGEQDGKTKLFFKNNLSGKNTADLLQDIIEGAIKTLPIPKSMRWNQTEAEFIRPIRWLLVLLGNDVIPINLFGIQSDRATYGHRFHSPAKITIEHPLKYQERLNSEGQVQVDFNQRQQSIVNQVNTLSEQVKGTPSYSQELLDEITGLVEAPHALLGEFDAKFLEVHKELLISTMQDNQKYIPLLDSKGALLPKFIIISNIDSKSPDVVKHGNEKVIVPRFEDAMFFWQRDKNNKLEDNLSKLKNVVYEKQLGSLKDKTLRIEKLAAYLSDTTHANKEHCERAALLSKCDLVTETVAEFPKLQGIVGRNLASLTKEHENISSAIEEQYLPKQAGGVLPKSEVGITLALADRIDTLVGIFAAGKKPTGLKDPYGLRRAALAILRIIIETPLDVNLRACLEKAAILFPDRLNAISIVDDVSDYINDRYRAYFSDREIPTDVIDSVLANRPTHPNEVAKKIAALARFKAHPSSEALAAANKRIRNILKKIEQEDFGKVDSALFTENAETNLNDALENLSSDVDKLYADHDYTQALNKLANLREPVDQFFDDVMVMDKNEKLKNNRIALLSKVDSLFMQVADFSRLQS